MTTFNVIVVLLRRYEAIDKQEDKHNLFKLTGRIEKSKWWKILRRRPEHKEANENSAAPAAAAAVADDDDDDENRNENENANANEDVMCSHSIREVFQMNNEENENNGLEEMTKRELG